MSDQVFIAWAAYQRRAETMQSYFGYKIYNFPATSSSPLTKPFSYLAQAHKTLRIIIDNKVEVLWIQLPPTFLVHLLLLIRALTGRPRHIIADCHNRVFRAPWSSLPGSISLLKHCAVALVHNGEIAQSARAMGAAAGNLMVLEDPPAILKQEGMIRRTEQPTVLVPCSFNPDEPIATLLDAAKAAPEMTFFVTGKIEKAKSKGYVQMAPANVVWTGFLSEADYEKLVLSSTVILGLTTIEGIQLSVASEAVGAGKAMVLSDTIVLRGMFGDAALFSENTPEALATTLREAVARADELERLSSELRERRWAHWYEQASRVKSSYET